MLTNPEAASMDNLLACLLPLPLMLVLFAVAMALAARLKSRRLKAEYRTTQAENRLLRGQNATYESTVTALQLENKTLTDGSTSSADQNRLLEQQVRQLTDENTDLRYNRDVAYRQRDEAEAEFVRRYLERQRLRWFALLADPENRCHSRSEIGARVFYPMLRFLGYGEEAFGADEPEQAVYAVYSVFEIVNGGPPRRLFILQAVNPGIGITEAIVRDSDTAAYRAGARKFVLADADTFVLYRVGFDKQPVVRCPLVDLASYWNWIYAELAPSAFPP
ncbi:MAG: hypothetical protein U0X20_08715 [Caldilineaceae bacterium]